MPKSKKIAIIGGGIAGLSAAYFLESNRQDFQVEVIEAKSSLGGALATDRWQDYVIERSADMFVSDPRHAVDLCEDLGFEDQLIPTNHRNRFSSICFQDRLIRIPTGFSLLAANQLLPMLRTPLLSWRGKLRLLVELFLRPRSDQPDESLKSFAVRHYGEEIFERLIQPLVAGIYSAKAEELSIQATLKRFVDMEREHGSLIRAAQLKKRKNKFDRESSGARYGMFLSFKNGIGSLVDRLVDELQNQNVTMTIGQPIRAIQPIDVSRWRLDGGRGFQREVDGVIVAVNSQVASQLLPESMVQTKEKLETITMGSLIVVSIATDHESFVNEIPKGFGFVVPEIENRDLIACSFSSNKFDNRAGQRKFLMRAFLGGRRVNDFLHLEDRDLVSKVVKDLGELVGFKPTDKTEFRVTRWENCMPQYKVGHLELVATIKEHLAKTPRIQLAGCSYDGVGIPACIESGKIAAKKILAAIKPGH
ncbi:MAG: protoporphyrinogen oxidase [Planctomycetota bacterium]